MDKVETIKILQKLVRSREELAQAFSRKKWLPSEKAMAIADVQNDIRALQTAIEHLS